MKFSLRKVTLWGLCSLLVGTFCLAAAQAQPAHGQRSGYIPQRVYDAKEKRFSDFEAMMADLARQDVIFVGEQHDDPATHRLEQAVLEALLRRRVPVTVALEMFERDTQATLDAYLAGRLSEEEFLKTSRPWPRYATDYRPLVELAHAHGWPVIAGNVPRRLASQVSRQGLDSINGLSETDRKFAAAQFQCPQDDYFKRFQEVMSGSHPTADGKTPAKQPDAKEQEAQRAMVERFYQAQCVKDETMAESIAKHVESQTAAATKSVVVHFNGAFHSDYRLGTTSRTVRRLPKAKVKVVSIVPVDDLDTVKADEFRKRGDYIVFALKPAKAATDNKAAAAPAKTATPK